jgi:O-antigen ligase
MQVFTLAASVISAIVILQDQEVSVFAKCFLKPRAAVFYQFNHTGYYLNLSIVCLMGLYLYGSSRKERIYYSLSLAFQIYAILVNSTLGSYLGSLGALIFMVIFYLVRKEQGKWRVLVPVVIFILVSWASYMGWVPTSSGEDMRVNIETLTKDTSDIVSNPLEATDAGHGRMTLWQEGLKMVAKSPIFGYGPDSIDPDLTTEEIKTKFWTERADNEFIQCAISNGIPGLLLYLLTLFSMAIYRLRDLKKLSAETVIAAGCVIAYLISGCFGNTMFYTTPYLFLFLGMVAHEKNK